MAMIAAGGVLPSITAILYLCDFESIYDPASCLAFFHLLFQTFHAGVWTAVATHVVAAALPRVPAALMAAGWLFPARPV
jgi:hypothetical protein